MNCECGADAKMRKIAQGEEIDILLCEGCGRLAICLLVTEGRVDGRTFWYRKDNESRVSVNLVDGLSEPARAG